MAKISTAVAGFTTTATVLLLALSILGAAAMACGADGKSGGSQPSQARTIRGKTGAPHLSLKAYPGAVVSLTDPATGIRVSVEPNGEDLTAVDRAGKALWKINPVERWGKPRMGAPVIRHLSIERGQVHVTVGKHLFGEVDVKTGRDRPKGSD